MVDQQGKISTAMVKLLCPNCSGVVNVALATDALTVTATPQTPETYNHPSVASKPTRLKLCKEDD